MKAAPGEPRAGPIPVLEMIASGAPLAQTLDALVREIEAGMPKVLGSILLLDDDGQRLRHGAAPSLPVEFCRRIDGEPIGPAAGSCGTAAYRREMVVVEDITTDPLWSAYREVAAAHGLRACWSTPIFDHKRAMLGTFAMYLRTRGRPTRRHLRQVELATHTAAIAIARDREERAMRDSEARYRALAESSPDAIMIHSEGRIVMVNRALVDLFGAKDASDLVGRSATFMLPPEFLEMARRRISELYAGRAQPRAEQVYVRLDGSPVSVEIAAAPMSMDGRPAAHVTVRDITERKRAEEDLRRFRLAMDSSADMILLIDRSSMRYVDVNPAVTKLLGYSREEVLTMGPQDILPVSRADLERSYDELLANPAAAGALNSYYICKDGSHLPFESSRHVLRSGDRWLIAAISRDIRERMGQQQRIERLSRVYATLSGINGLMIRERDRHQLFCQACRIAIEAGGFRMAWVGVVDGDGSRLSVVAGEGVDRAYLDKLPLALDERSGKGFGLAGRAMQERKPVVVDDLATDTKVMLRDEARNRGLHSAAFLPLSSGNRVIGVLALYATETAFFDESEMKLLTELAGDISFALEHIEKSEKVDYLALYDPLTGLANRALFNERLAQHLQSSAHDDRKIGVAVVDIERFKTINDSLGRQAGDDLLKQVARRFVSFSSETTGLARLDRDHFAVLVPGLKTAESAARLTEQRFNDCFGTPYVLGETELRVSARLGIALYPDDGADAETLLRNAESALKNAKALGERYLFYTQRMSGRVAERLTLENRLRQALEKEEFVLHYQPKVDLDSGAIVGVEALIRWQSRDLGLVPPAEFIPLMEETGLILDVGAWALKRAVADHRGWAEQGLQPPRIAVNVSPIQLRRNNFVAMVEEALKGGRDPAGVDLEITETLIMADIEGNIAKLKKIRDLGVRVAIDDFGTGYSSLAYLAKLPVQLLKIDRSFIVTMLDDADTMMLVQTIISLAHSLRLKVVAEGVDSEAQAKMLRLLRCDEMQGYLYSEPLPFAEVSALIATQKPVRVGRS